MSLPGIAGYKVKAETFGSKEVDRRVCSPFRPGGTTVDPSDDASFGGVIETNDGRLGTIQEKGLVDAFCRFVAETYRKTGFHRRATRLTVSPVRSATPSGSSSFSVFMFCYRMLPSRSHLRDNTFPRPQSCRLFRCLGVEHSTERSRWQWTTHYILLLLVYIPWIYPPGY